MMKWLFMYVVFALVMTGIIRFVQLIADYRWLKKNVR